MRVDSLYYNWRCMTEHSCREGPDTGSHAVDLYEGAAAYYARYRPGYPEEVLNTVRAAYHLDGTGRLLDLGCGTGQLAIPLHADFAEVVAVDVSPEMLAEGRRQGERADATNIRWLQMRAEDISPALGHFRLVTLGSSFHWMDQDEVLRRSHDLLVPPGGLALLSNPSIWNSDQPLAEAVRRVVQGRLGLETRTRQGAFPAGHPRFEDLLAQSPFVGMQVGEHHWQRTVDIDGIIGELYSTSFCNKALLGDKVESFEDDLRRALLALEPSGRFAQDIATQYILAWKQ